MRFNIQIKHRSFIRAIVVILWIYVTIPVNSYSQGLQFSSNDQLIANRTSYNVFGEESHKFKDFFKLDFDLAILDQFSFGYILYVKNEKNNLYYNLTYSNENDSLSYLKLSIESKTILLSIPLKKKELQKQKWQKLSLLFDARNDSIKITVNNKINGIARDITGKMFEYKIYFGKHDSFIDVPDIAIRNLKITSQNKEYHFTFNEIDGNIVHDFNGTPTGIVENPIWMINQSYNWEFLSQLNTKQVSAINFDNKNQQFIVINTDSIFLYNKTTQKLEKKLLPTSTPVPLRLGQSFINTRNNRLYVYEVNDVEIDKPTVASIGIDQLDWDICSYEQFPTQLHHHVNFLNTQQNKYFIFGGFGNKKFSNDFATFDLAKNKWETIEFTGDIISPRFFAGLTILNKNEFLIFGGVGNPSGDQSAGRIYYHDCYRVNTNEKSIKKLWDATDFKQRTVSSQNMILSADSNYFYTLCYPEYIPNTYLKLYKLSIADGSFEILGDSIPMISERIRTNANLYINKSTNEIYCTIQEFNLDGSSKIKFYSISNPPVSKEDFFTEEDKKTLPSTDYTLLILIIIASSVLSYYIINKLLIRHWRLNQNQQKLNKAADTLKHIKRPIKNSIYLFGDFTVYDKKGKEISYLFSPKVKLLFLIILFHSKENGITSNDIYTALWPDKPVAKAKNSKGVTLNQLRKILADIDGIELKIENKHHFIEITPPLYYDYFECKELFDEIEEGNINDMETTEKLIDIVSAGRFLNGIEDEYFDKYIQYYETDVMKIIPYQLYYNFKNGNYPEVILLAKIIYNIDLLNEVAFHYELMSYIKIDMVEKAKKRYNSFIVDYKKELNDDYPHTFGELIKHKSLEKIKDKSSLME